jgi:hypothetical protein
MILTAPENKNLTPLEKTLVLIERKLKAEPNGQSEYKITIEQDVHSTLCSVIRQKYINIGWKAIHISYPKRSRGKDTEIKCTKFHFFR